jgi:acyl-CoA dehydrogenase
MIRDQNTLNGILEAVSRFVRERLVPAEAEVAEQDAIPDDIVADMRSLGLFGLSIPEEYGGMGLTLEEELEVIIRLAHASPVFRSLVGTNNGIGSKAILYSGNEDQKQRYLPPMARGELIGSFALTEPEAGSDAASLKTRAIRHGDVYVVNGGKRYISNAPQAGVFTLMARTDPDEPGAAGVSCFAVDADLDGITLGKPDRKMGMAGSHTCDVIFQDCRVPAGALLGSEGEGFRIAMQVLDRGRLMVAAASVGAAERLLRDSLRYAEERRQFGKPIAEQQLVQAMLADARAESYAARSMTLDAARRYDEGRPVTTDAACCKLFASEMAGRVADRAVQIHGGAGYMRDYRVEQFYRDVRLFRLFEGTSQIQQLVIARNLRKEAAW